MKTQNKIIGKLGEDLAAKLLQDKGYQIIERNWGSKWGEIDIIAKKGEMYIFVEVKTKVGENFGPPEQMVNYRKLQQIQRMASTYAQAVNSAKRIDVVAIVLPSGSHPEGEEVQRIDHYEAVY
ncbi:MAG: YraN family protein [Patescibacteria group bacterium]